MRPELEPILHALLARPERELDLDLVGEAIGTTAVSAQDVEELFAELERRGRGVEDLSSEAASAALGRVLSVARALRLETGAVPTPAAIAERADMSLAAVRAALLFARVVQR